MRCAFFKIHPDALCMYLYEILYEVSQRMVVNVKKYCKVNLDLLFVPGFRNLTCRLSFYEDSLQFTRTHNTFLRQLINEILVFLSWFETLK